VRIIEPCCPVQVVDMTLTVFTTCPVLLEQIKKMMMMMMMMMLVSDALKLVQSSTANRYRK